jgi:hypothetical protein
VLVAVPKLSLIGAATGRLPDSTIYAELAGEERLPLVAGVLAADPLRPCAESRPHPPQRRRLPQAWLKALPSNCTAPDC